MYLKRLICLAGLVLMSSVGCCHTQCVSNSCNSCGGGGCCLTNWFQSKMASCRMRCNNYSWCDDCSGGCAVCGGTNCGLNGAVDGGMTYGGGSPGCGCGQSHNNQYAPTSPASPSVPAATPTDPIPMPIPTQTNPEPTRTNEPNPAPGASDSTTYQRPVNGQTQHVSVEEFQRLPGVVISGPTPAAGSPTLAPPTLSNVSVPPRAGQVQQAQWVPAR
jgi:hypothetical protein